MNTHSSITTIQADLTARIDALPRDCATNHMASDLEAIRRIAKANGMYPAITVIHAIDAALARGERGALVQGWLPILRDAVRCERTDAGADTTFAAACAVRYG